ncbi:MAG: MEDS domain-containing protein [Acidobacteriia bacterium]|nr:MEDS domain-containing protein [Terriglobia bacterium]
MNERLRKSGIQLIGEVPWGTHFCQFYKTKKDLLDILIPYFKAGLENHEFCMWVTSEPLTEDEALRAMKKAVPRFDRYLDGGQMEIIPHTGWYLKDNRFSSRRVLNGWVKRHDSALARGYQGLRLTGNTFWLEKDDWKKFTDYEETVDSVIGRYAMIALCTYSLDRCGASEVVDVISNHRFALIKRAQRWELIESAERKRMETERRRIEEELRKSNQRLELLSNTASGLLMTEVPQQIVNSLCQEMLPYLDCHAFFNYLFDEHEQRLHLNAWAGIPDETARIIEWLDLGVAVCGCAARDACRIVAENIPETPDPRTDLVRSLGIKAYACHPLFSGGHVIGTLSFGTRTRTRFEDDELALMKTVADQVAIAMERVNQFERLRAAQTELLQSHEQLENRVRERTVELASANARLREEIEKIDRAEEKIREQAALLELAHDAILVRDLDSRVVFWNHGAEEIYGWSREQALGKATHDLLATRFPKPVAEIESEIIRAGRWEGELEHLRRDGHRISVESRWTLQRDAAGRPSAILEINNDITRRKAGQKALQAASLYARSLIEASLDPLVTISADGKIMDVNRATEMATGVARDHMIGSDFSEYFTEPEKARAGYQQVYQDGYVRDYPLAICHANGQVTEVLYNATLYRNESGEVQGVFAAARDVTALRRAEEKLKVYTEKLEWSNRELQDFAFVASHDLQEPLRKIQSFGERLKIKYEAQLGHEGRDYLERMQKAAHRMGSLIRDLLGYSRITTNAEPFVPVDLSILVNEVLADLEVSIEQNGGRVEAECLPTIEADPNQMRQLFQNLISNALKFHGNEKPRIRICERPLSTAPVGRSQVDSRHQIIVEDNGIGFDEKYLTRIFVPFQRLHGRGEYEGTGMGLAICRKIVERHGGSITARSAPGKGSTFIITLPRRQPKGDNAS